jgi:ATP/maltotriose-dependent transcriptional regulator MalT
LRFGLQRSRSLEEIVSVTGGWPAVLELAGSLQLRKKDPGTGLNPLAAKSLYDYLAAEVFEKLPAQDKRISRQLLYLQGA